MKKNVSLVLSGGGARGIAHIGVIEELEKQGFNIKSISGTSMGALIGGVYAVGKIKEYKEWIYSLDKLEIFRLIDFTFSSQGLVKGERVFKKMKKFIPDVNIEELKINYAATATDITNNKEIVFTNGRLYEAVRASVSIPTVFVPVKTKDSLLVDGGIMNNVPISNVKRTKNDILIVVNVNADVPVYKPPTSKSVKDKNQKAYSQKMNSFKNHLQNILPIQQNERFAYFNLISKTINILINQVSAMVIEKTPPDILINISIDSCGVFDFYKAEELVKIGKHIALKNIKEYKNKLNED